MGKSKITAIMTGFFLACCVGCNNEEKSTDTYSDSVARTDKTRVDTDTIVTDNDAKWVSEVLESSYAEIKYAQQAKEKATNTEVKSLARMLENDHSSLVSQLKDLAGRNNWTVATAETQDARDKIKDFSDDEVKEFQKQWTELMEDNHEKSIRKFENAEVRDTALRSWINNTIPKLKMHHDKIKEVQKKLK